MASRKSHPEFTFRLVPLVLRLLEAKGAPAAVRQRLLEGLPADAATAVETTAPLPRVEAFLAGAAADLQVPSLGLAMGAAVPRGTYAWIEFIARAATSLHDAFGAVSRYYRLLNKGAEIVPLERSSGVGLEIRVHGRRAGWGRELNEYTLALFVRIARELMPGWSPSRIWFAHATPDWPALEALAGAFGVTPTFGAATSGFECSRALAERPLPTGDAALQRLLQLQADEVMSQQVPLAKLARQVREELCRRLGKAEVGIEAVAPALGTTPRTLQRRLKEEGLSFQDVLDGAREQFAKGYLSTPQLSISEIAYLLGYSELRAFDRAFLRWTGESPNAWRKATTR